MMNYDDYLKCAARRAFRYTRHAKHVRVTHRLSSPPRKLIETGGVSVAPAYPSASFTLAGVSRPNKLLVKRSRSSKCDENSVPIAGTASYYRMIPLRRGATPSSVRKGGEGREGRNAYTCIDIHTWRSVRVTPFIYTWSCTDSYLSTCRREPSVGEKAEGGRVATRHLRVQSRSSQQVADVRGSRFTVEIAIRKGIRRYRGAILSRAPNCSIAKRYIAITILKSRECKREKRGDINKYSITSRARARGIDRMRRMEFRLSNVRSIAHTYTRRYYVHALDIEILDVR